MDRPTPIVALGLLLTALGFATCAQAGNTATLPDPGGAARLDSWNLYATTSSRYRRSSDFK